eukprot:1342546-Amorphochlora_amoeboformis.AAC.1
MIVRVSVHLQPKLSSEEWEDIRTNKEYHDTQAKEVLPSKQMDLHLHTPPYDTHHLMATNGFAHYGVTSWHDMTHHDIRLKRQQRCVKLCRPHTLLIHSMPP